MQPTARTAGIASERGQRGWGDSLRLLPLCIAATVCTTALAQNSFTNHLNPLSATTNGVHLYSVYGFTGYFSSPLAYNGIVVPSNLGADMGFGGGASIGFNYLRSGSGLSVTYSPSYIGFRENSGLNSLNHALSLTFHHRRTPGTKWQTGFSVTASTTDTNQFLFGPTNLSRVVTAPATFDDLAGGIVAGNFTDDQIASLLTGAPVPNSGAELLLYGDRVLNAGVQASLSYAYSPRLSINTVVSGSRFQSLPSDSVDSTTTHLTHLLSNSTSVTGGIGVSYSLSPRTQGGADVTTTRFLSRFQDMYSTTGTLSLGRVLSRRWFTQVRAGAGVVTPVRQSAQLYQGPQFVGGAALGYKTRGHTVMASYELLRTDPYGLGAESSSSAGAAWSWRSRGTWSTSVSGDYLRTSGSPYGKINSWRAQATLGKALTRQTGISLSFSALSNRDAFTANINDGRLYGVVLSVYWSPGGARHRKVEN